MKIRATRIKPVSNPTVRLPNEMEGIVTAWDKKTQEYSICRTDKCCIMDYIVRKKDWNITILA